MPTARGHRWFLALQIVLSVAVVAFLARRLAANWSTFRATKIALDFHVWWLLLSFAVLAVVTALQVASWRLLLGGWKQRVRFWEGVRIWYLANLGRYVPGKVWSVAGMVVLAERAGVQRWASAASAVAVQAVGIGTAVVLVAVATPHAASPLHLAAAAVVALGTVGLLAWKGALPRIGRMMGAASEWHALPPGAVLSGAGLTLLSWIAYGYAFWALARGLGLPPTLPLADAASVFALGYILGLLALFAPGGIGVREATFLALLTPYLGAGGAIALSVASRLQLTIVEAAAGFVVLVLVRHKRGEPLDTARR